MSIIQGNAHTSAGGGYQIERSLRFNSADSAYLNRTPGSAGNRRTWTWSGWVKRSALGSTQTMFAVFDYASGGATNNQHGIRFTSSDTIEFWNYSGAYAGQKITTQVFRDVSAWYHVVAIWDTPNATASNRMRLYINGSEVTVFGTSSDPTQNTDGNINRAFLHTIGTFYDPDFGSPTNNLNGYLTEINFIDGQALTPSSFGETDSNTGIWKPKAYSGTYGTNGFYLKFADNSGTTSTTLGKDSSGNGNNWTPNNFSVTAGAGNDSLVDSPTNYGSDTGAGGEVRGNYCTMNPLDSKNGTASNGNLLWTATASQSDIRGTFAIPASGKWYMECTVGSNTSASSAVSFGLATSSVALDASNAVTGLYQLYASSSGYLSLNGTNVSSSLGTWTAGDVLQIAVDVDNTKMWLGKNNTWYNSSGGTTGNPSTGANATSTTSMVGLFPFSNCYQNNATWNAGQRAFAYTAPSGFKALCTQNLPTPTIGATSTTQAGDYFNTVLYTGNGATGQTITGVGFQPDFVWVKSRSSAYDNGLQDVLRGVTKDLNSNNTDAEETRASSITAFTSDGFTLGGNDLIYNASGGSIVAWNWKANGAGSSNTAGTITSTVSANTTSGFSIVTYTGTGSNATVGHGLGIKPGLMIFKSRNNAGSAADWMVYHSSLGATKNLRLQSTAAQDTQTAVFNDTEPTTTVFTVGTNNNINASTGTMVAYCFAPVAGYSAFGSYTGNGSADGPFVYTDFKPKFVLFKNASTATNWWLQDTARNTYNVCNLGLRPNTSDAEQTETTLDILSNGFKVRVNNTTINGSGNTIVYAAFAENPFKYSLAR